MPFLFLPNSPTATSSLLPRHNSAIILANALVTSKLDYCNSLFYNLPATSIARLQRVQNALARVVCPTVKRSEHITPTLRKLHCYLFNNGFVLKLFFLRLKLYTFS